MAKRERLYKCVSVGGRRVAFPDVHARARIALASSSGGGGSDSKTCRRRSLSVEPSLVAAAATLACTRTS